MMEQSGRAGRGPRRGLHLRRRHLHVAQPRSRAPSSPSSPAWSAPASAAERELGLSLYWIFDAVRHFTVEEAERVFRKAAEMRPHYPSIIGIGLGGDERRAGSEPFRALYAQAARRRSAAHQPRRRNHRPRGHPRSALHRLGAHRPRALGDSGPRTSSRS